MTAARLKCHGSDGDSLFDSDQKFAVGLDSIERDLELEGRDVPELAMEALRIAPVHPAERRELEIFDRLPRSRPGGSPDEFGLVVPVDRLGQLIVETVAHVPNRRGRPDLREPFA